MFLINDEGYNVPVNFNSNMFIKELLDNNGYFELTTKNGLSVYIGIAYDDNVIYMHTFKGEVEKDILTWEINENNALIVYEALVELENRSAHEFLDNEDELYSELNEYLNDNYLIAL